MTTLAEHDARIDALFAEANSLTDRIRKLAAEALDRPAALQERAELRERLDAMPGMIGEATRRKVLATMAELRAQRDELAAAYAEESAAADASRATVAALVKEKRAQAADYARGQELQAEIYKVGRAGEAQLGKADGLRFRLEGVYANAARHGLWLDQSDLQRKYPVPGVPFALADSKSHAEQAAVKLASLAEDNARRELIGTLQSRY